jgi:apolipoprotein N-acyltransferase
LNVALRAPDGAQRSHVLARLTAAFAAGASLNAGFAPFGWWPIALLAPAALFALIRGLPPRRACAAGAAFGAGLFTFGTYWLYTCLHVFGLVPVWLTIVLQTVLIAAMSAYPAALCYLANRFWLKPGATRHWLVLPALWVLLEWLRGWLLSGFPWLSTGYAMIDSPLRGWAPIFGVYGVTWAAATVSVALSVVVMPGVPLARRCLAVGAALILFVADGAAPLDPSGGHAHCDRGRARRGAPGSEVAAEESRAHHAALLAADRRRLGFPADHLAGSGAAGSGARYSQLSGGAQGAGARS